MPPFRKDPFGAAWVLISPERGLQASDFGSARGSAEASPLSPGRNPGLREIAAVRPPTSAPDAPDWRLRVLEHPSALLRPLPFEVRRDGPFLDAPSTGVQEILVEHPDAHLDLDDMGVDHLVEVLRLYRDRLALHATRPDVRHVQVTRNVGRAAGALYDHPHAQVLAIPVPNRWVEEERAAAEAHHAETGRCLFCEVLEEELKRRDRIVTRSAAFAAFAPYAAKSPFETWIVPRRHGSAFHEMPTNEMPALAEMLATVVRAINAALDRPPYNLLLHTLPQGGDAAYHWHLELLPRLTNQAGFDWSNGFYVNPTPPEDAARFLREALALQEVAP